METRHRVNLSIFLLWNLCRDIGVTTMGTGGDQSPNFLVGRDQECIGPTKFW